MGVRTKREEREKEEIETGQKASHVVTGQDEGKTWQKVRARTGKRTGKE